MKKVVASFAAVVPGVHDADLLQRREGEDPRVCHGRERRAQRRRGAANRLWSRFGAALKRDDVKLVRRFHVHAADARCPAAEGDQGRRRHAATGQPLRHSVAVVDPYGLLGHAANKRLR